MCPNCSQPGKRDGPAANHSYKVLSILPWLKGPFHPFPGLPGQFINLPDTQVPGL